MIRKRLLFVSSMSLLLHFGASGCTSDLFPDDSSTVSAGTPGQNPGPGPQPGPGGNPNPSDDGAKGGASNPDNTGGNGKSGDGKGGEGGDGKGGTDNGPGEGESGPEPECEEGQIDENCLTFPDGSPIEFPTGVPLGSCEPGTRVCSGGFWGSCEGAIAPKPNDDCNVKDDDSDCDGVPNVGCDCTPDETRRCGETDKGACEYGKQHCVNGKWDKECVGAILPGKELCDGKGIDENCDGKADLDDKQCECIDDTQEYCVRAGKEGDCKWGQKTCNAGKWSRCNEWAQAIPEICGARPPVEGVQWTGDENCDGSIDTSPLGEPGPEGCEPMMLDQDGDGFGKIGPDLARIRGKHQIKLIGTACLCPQRPDMAEKRSEGWVPVNGRQNQDCGDCPAGYDGHLAYPGSQSTATHPNRCLTALKWPQALNRGPSELLDFDLNCDGDHTDPSNRNGNIAVLKCRRSGPQAMSCTSVGPGRLISRGRRGVWCGGTFEFGECYARIGEESAEGEEIDFVAQYGGSQVGYDSDGEDSGPDDDTGPKEPKKVFLGCARRPTSGRHQIRCQ